MEAPKIPRLFGIKTKKPSQFYFEPRYYSERKEKMDKRYAQIGKEVELEKKNSTPESQSDEFRSTLRENWGSSSHTKKAGNTFNTRIIIYAVVLLGLAYFILK
jgi:hypothetical protein